MSMFAPEETLASEELLAAIVYELRYSVGDTLLEAEAAAGAVEGAAVDLDRALRRFRRLQGQMEHRIQTLTLLPALLRGDRQALPPPQPRSVAAALSAVARPSPMLRTDVPAGLRVLAVPGTLDIVLGHLLDNARRHGGPAATVSVRARAVDATPDRWPAGHPMTITGPMVLLSVADDGPGIPPTVRPHLFRPVKREQLAPPGLGIGLWLSRQLVRVHGGDLVLDDTAPGAAFLSLWPAAPSSERPPVRKDGWPQNPQAFGAQVQALRMQAGLTKSGLAARAGVGLHTLRLVELGQRAPRAATRARLISTLAPLRRSTRAS